MTEKELTADVITMAHLFNWTVAHFRSVETKRRGWQTPVQADGAGFPDLCLARERVVWIELKVGYNKLGPAQEMWRDLLLNTGAEWYCFTDKDWMEGKIDRVLR